MAKTASLSIALGILQAVNSAADVFPPLKTVTNAALFVAQTADSFHTNKEDWTRLSSHVQIYVAALLKHIGEDSDPMVDDWKESLLSLDRSLQEIQEKISELRSETFLNRLWRYFKTRGQFVKDLQRDFDDAIKLCNFRASLMTTSEVVKHLQQGDPNKTIELLLQKFKDDIAFDNDCIESLRQLPDARGASWDSSRTCLLGTRMPHLREIEMWIANCITRDTPEILLIADPMGSGKSTLAHSICQEAQRKRWLVTSFFFSRLRREEVTSRHLFGSLIRGFCQVNKGTGDTIARILRDDATLLDASPTRQFQEIILPICPLLPKSVPLVVVVDALDEGCDTELLQILRDGVPLLPANFCIIVTSRPEDSVMSWLEHHSHIQLLSLSLIRGNHTQQDIEKHIHNKFRYPPFENTVFPPQLIQDFVHRSKGLFLWVDVILEYIKPFLHCDQALREIIDSSAGTPAELLDAELKVFALYEQILSKLMWKDKVLVRAYKAFMGSVVTAKEPLSINALVLLFSYDQPVDGDTMVKVANRLRSLLNNFSPGTREEPIRLLHASVREYLSQHIPSTKPYYLDIEECNCVMAKLTLSTIDNEIKAHVPPLGYLSGEWDIDIFHVPPKLPPIPPGSISEQLSYSCRFFIDHTIQSGRVEELAPLWRLHEVLSRHAQAVIELTAAMGSTTNLGHLRSWVKDTFPSTFSKIFDDLDPLLSKYLYDIVSYLRGRVGRQKEALLVVQAARATCHRLVDKYGSRYMLHLARCMNMEGLCLGDLERDEEALATLEEAVKIIEELAGNYLGIYEPDLARALNNLSRQLGVFSRNEESLRHTEKALEIYRRLSQDQPNLYEPFVGWSLVSVAYRLLEMGRLDEATPAIQEGLRIYRSLADRDHETFDQYVSSALHISSIMLDQMGRHPVESIVPLLDAVGTYLRLVKANPELFEPNLAACLGTLSIRFIQLENWQEAFEATEKAVPIYRRLALREPELYEGKLSDALDGLCTCLVGLGRDDDALVAIDESIDLTRKLLEHKSMLTLESHLAYSLHERHLVLKNLNRYGESLRCLEESVDVHRRIFEANPTQMHASNLGKALDNLCALYHSLGRDEDASLIRGEAVELHQMAGDWTRHAQASTGALASQPSIEVFWGYMGPNPAIVLGEKCSRSR
ncbi:hypothetical protein H1R20_g3231, partial [Candolleomyces eurysporus]